MHCICVHVFLQAEAKQNNGNVFRRNLLTRLQQEFKGREETRKRSVQEWVCYVSFICNVFDYLKVLTDTAHRPLNLLGLNITQYYDVYKPFFEIKAVHVYLFNSNIKTQKKNDCTRQQLDSDDDKQTFSETWGTQPYEHCMLPLS